MKIIFKEGTKEMKYQIFVTDIRALDYNNYYKNKESIKNRKIEEHINMIVHAFLFNVNEHTVPCYSFDGFHHKYGRHTHPVDEIIFYYYSEDIIYKNYYGHLCSYLNWELINGK